MSDSLSHRIADTVFFIRSLMLHGRKGIFLGTTQSGFYAPHFTRGRGRLHSLTAYEDGVFLFLLCSALAVQLSNDADAILAAVANAQSDVYSRFQLANTQQLQDNEVPIYEQLIAEGKNVYEAFRTAIADRPLWGKNRVQAILTRTLALNADGKADPTQLIPVRGKKEFEFPLLVNNDRGPAVLRATASRENPLMLPPARHR